MSTEKTRASSVSSVRGVSGLKHFNKNRGKFVKVPLAEVLMHLGVDELQAKHMSALGFCPACGDVIDKTSGQVKLCAADYAAFRELTWSAETATPLAESISRLRDGDTLKDENFNVLSVTQFLAATTGKSLVEAGTETVHGFCPVCGDHHKRSTKGLVAGSDGVNRRVLFCEECYGLFLRQNRLARAIALTVLP